MKTTPHGSGSPSSGTVEGGAKPSCNHGIVTVPMKTPLIHLRRKERADPEGEFLVAGSAVAQWVNKIDITEERLKRQEDYLKKFRAHLDAAKKYLVDFTNPWSGTRR